MSTPYCLRSRLALPLLATLTACGGAPTSANRTVAKVDTTAALDPSQLTFREFPSELPAHASELASTFVQDVGYDDARGRLYVLHPGALSISDDDGKSFRHVERRQMAGAGPFTAIHVGGGVVYVDNGFNSVLVSEDGGATWSNRWRWHSSPLIASGSDLYQLADGIADNMSVSHDHAVTWSALPSRPPSGIGDSACVDGDIIVLPVGSLVRYSVDRGATWNVLQVPYDVNQGPARFEECAIANGNVYVHDAGRKQLDVMRPSDSTPTLRPLSYPFAEEQTGHAYLGRLIAHGTRVAFTDRTDGAGKFAAVSNDQGATWQRVGWPGAATASDYWSSLALSDNVLWLGTPAGRGLDILNSSDGTASLAAATHPFGGAHAVSLSLQFDAFNAYAHDLTYYAWNDQDIFRSDDGGVSWSRLAPPWSSSNAASAGSVAYESGNTLLISYADQLYASHDRGATWDAPLAAGGLTRKILPLGADVLVVSGGNSSLAPLVLHRYGSTHPLLEIAADPTIVDVTVDGTTLYALYPATMKRSDDLGLTFVDVPLPVAPAGPYHDGPALAFDGQNAVFLANGQLWASSDHGASWTATGRRLADGGAQPLVLFGTNVIHGDSSEGLGLSADLGAHWTRLPGSGPPLVTADRICVLEMGLLCADR
jgi:hypothetical protein